ncbi:MAG: DUF3817 domain-containing protein [Nannocystales bacterium]
MTAWAVLRFCKFISVALLTAAVLGGIFGGTPSARRRASLFLGTCSIIGVLVFGYALTKKVGASIGDPWVSRALFAGLLGYGAACWTATAQRVRPVPAALALTGLLGAFGWMSARNLEHAWLLGLALPAAIATPAAIFAARRSTAEDPESEASDATTQWFSWLARAEGVSLLMLFGVYMPLKHGAGIVLDGGQGWFGWAHGVFQLIFIVALVVTGRVRRWSVARQAVGFVASLIPLGTFWFERHVRPD